MLIKFDEYWLKTDLQDTTGLIVSPYECNLLKRVTITSNQDVLQQFLKNSNFVYLDNHMQYKNQII